MARPRTYRAQGLVLKSVPSGEADLVAVLLSPEQGKLRAIARGARKPSSKLVGHLEPFTLLDLTLARGHGLDTVAQAQVLESYGPLRASLEATSRALYLAELVDGFAVEGAPNVPVYELLRETLAWLEARSRGGGPATGGATPVPPLRGHDPSTGPGHDLALRRFELLLLKHTGFLPELYLCVECRQRLQPGAHRYTPNGGGLLCPRCTPPRVLVLPVSVQAVKVLRFLERAPLEEVERLRVAPALGEELRGLLGATLRAVLEREVRSAAFLAHLARLAGAAHTA